MTTPTQDLYKLHQTSPFIELYRLDLTVIGGTDVFHFTPNVEPDGSPIVFNGNNYLSLPVWSDGWELTANGTQPRPAITFSNVDRTLMTAVLELGDIVGAQLDRVRTFEKYLDGKPSADPTKYITPYDTYYVHQRLAMNSKVISWQLASPVEAFALQFPARQFLKDKDFPGISRVRGAV